MTSRLKRICKWQKTLLLTLLFFTGINSWAANVKFIIINNKGKAAFNYTIETTTLRFPEKNENAFTTNYRFYTTEADAVADASSHVAQPSALALGATASASTSTYYVRYDVVSNPAVNINSGAWYFWKIRERKQGNGSGRWWYVYYDSTDGKYKFALTNTRSSAFLFRFDSNGDPYDIHIVNKQALVSNANSVLTVAGLSGADGDKVKFGTSTDKIADGSYYPHASSNFSCQTFYIEKQWDGFYHVVAAYNGMDYQPEMWADGNSTNEKYLPYYMNANGTYSGTYGVMNNGTQLQCFRGWRTMIPGVSSDPPASEDKSTAKCAFEAAGQEVTYHIVNGSGTTVESVTKWHDVGQTLSLTSDERTRLTRAACTLSSTFYSDVTCTSAIATVTAGLSDIYIPYTVDATELRDTYHIVFSTESDPVWLNVMVNNTKRIVSYNSSNNELPTSANGPTELINAEAQWAFIGDPYSMKIINRANPSKAATAANGNSGTKVYLQNYDANHSRWCMRVGKVAGSVQLKVQGWGVDDYSAYWNAAGGSGSIQLYSANNKNYFGDDNNIYVASPPSQLYCIPNHQDGVIAVARWGDVNADGSFKLPDEIKSPLIPTDANYKFFKTEAQARAWTLNPTDANATAQGAITNKSQLDATDSPVYVGYKYVAGESELDLSGTTWYEMYYEVNATTNRYGQQHPTNANATYTTNTVNDAELSRFLWKFDGSDGSTSIPDPYGFRLVNKGAGAALSFPTTGNDNTWYLDGNFTSPVSRFFIRKVNGKWCIGATGVSTSTSTYSQMGMRNYIFWLYMNENNKAIRITRNNNTQNPYAPGINGDNRAAAYLSLQAMDVADFTFHVPNRLSGRDLTLSKTINDYSSIPSITLPAELERKYVSTTTFYASYNPSVADYNARFSNPITTYSEAKAAGGNIYVKYTVGTMPFEVSTDYDNAKWYRIKVVEGDVYAHLSETAQVAGSDDTYTHDYQYAFFGDPYELKVMNRAGGSGKYLGVAAGATNQTPILPIADGADALNTWEILPQGSEDTNDFKLRVFGTAPTTPYYCGFYSSTGNILEGKACYFTSAITMRIDALPQRNYTYNIVDKDGRIAIKATVSQEVTTPVRFDNLPAGIASPYIADEEITAFRTKEDIGTSSDGSRRKYSLSDEITETPITAEGTTTDIYIRYTTDRLMGKWLHLRGARAFNIKVNGDYIYDSKAAGDELGTLAHETSDANKTQNTHLWYLTGQDPYAVNIHNIGTGRYFNFTTPSTLTLKETVDAGAFYILMDGNGTDGGSTFTQVEFMAASGDDVSTDYYHIGRDSGDATLSHNASSHAATIQTQVHVRAINATYHIIDKAGKELITASGTMEYLQVPTEWQSPLVSQYHYWKESDFNHVGDTYTLKSPTPTELEGPADVGEGGHIYVTYDVGSTIDLTGKTTYLLKYLNGESFYQEDGSDKLMSVKQKAVYPYNNGDFNLYIYGQEQWEKQLSNGATTRSRFPWFLVSTLKDGDDIIPDPYHVKIKSRQNHVKVEREKNVEVARYNGSSWLRTYIPEDYNQIVTGVVTDHSEIVGDLSTEYMILGTPGHGKLVTVNTIEGAGIADDAIYGKRRLVNSFEQYWKNNPTSNNLLEAGGKSRVTADEEDVVLTSDQISFLQASNEGLHKGTWHKYKEWAYAAPWKQRKNVDYTTVKKLEYGDHWFQTISMGNGEFTLEEVELTPQLTILDQHGWEIVRLPLPNGPSDPTRAAKYAELKKYSSPMVERYHYWKKGVKTTGYHQYTVSDYAVDENGNEYTSALLGFLDAVDENGKHIGLLPDYASQGQVGSGSNAQSRDWFVTYDVKPEFANTYKGASTSNATEASAFLIKQSTDGTAANSKYATTTNGTSITTANSYDGSNSMLWYLRPNFNIDREMGYLYSNETGHQDEAKTKNETEADYFAAGQNGFDPYNLQIQSKAYNTKYWTTNTTAAALSGGKWVGTGSTGITLDNMPTGMQSKLSPQGYDQVTMRITNATFMVVDDGNGNMRLMPRFDNNNVETSINTLATQLPAAPANDAASTQTLLIIKPTTYTYHIINKSGLEAITWKDTYSESNSRYLRNGTYRPSLPEFLKAYGTTNYRFLPRSEFDSEAINYGIYTLVNPKVASYETFSASGDAADIYVVYDLTPDKESAGDADRSIADKGFDGSKFYNVSFNGGKYLNNTSGTISAKTLVAPATDKVNTENVWRIECNGGDPYDMRLYSYKESSHSIGAANYSSIVTMEGTEPIQTFILTNYDPANMKFELLATNSATSDAAPYGYLALDGSGNVKVLRDGSHQTANNVWVKLEPVRLDYTYELYDLSGNLTLKGTVTGVEDVTPSLPDYMRSPLVKEYYYFKDEDQAEPITSLTEANGTVYVSYLPYTPEEVSLKLDGSQTYTFHTKSNASTLAMGEGGRVSLRTKIGKRENYYEHTLLGRLINGQYDPYDVAIFSPFQNRYWKSDNINSTSQNSGTNRIDDLSCSRADAYNRFMILRGTTEAGVEYVQIAQKRLAGTTYYPNLTEKLKYVYHNGTNFGTGQGVSYQDGNENQLHVFQPSTIYHVMNMKGKDAVTGVESRLIIPSVTTPQIPTVLQSPVVKTYHYYDISAFNVSADGVYTLKDGATELRYISDATTNDIFVTYTNADLDKSWNLDGGVAYNIIYGPDPLTWNNITETLNSYFYYDPSQSSPLRVTGSYCTGYMRHIVVNDASDKGTDTNSITYEVEPAVTTEQMESNPYLWVFKGGDPYCLTVHNLYTPDNYINRTIDRQGGGYVTELYVSTNANEQQRTYMLVGRGTGDDTRFNLMSSGWCTGGMGPYSYQYIGRTYHDNPHRTTGRRVVLDGFNDWGWSYMYDEPLVTVKLVPQKVGKVTYIVKNKQGDESIRMKVEQTLRIKPEIPTAIRSPYAKGFKYYASDGTTEITTDNANTYVVNGATIIVKDYETDTDALSAVGLKLDGSETYNLKINGMYLYNSGDNILDHASPAKFDDSYHEWILEGNDPYNVQLKSDQSGKYIEQASFDNTMAKTSLATLVAHSSSNDVPAFILMNGQPSYFELLAATAEKTDASTTASEIKNRLTYLGYDTGIYLLGVGNDDSTPVFQSGLRHVQISLQEPLAGVTYHVMNLNGQQAVQYTVDASKGDALEVPEQIRSPFATNWQYWSDESCTTPITTVPNAGAQIYVTYTYNDDTKDVLQLDGLRFYNMQVADWYVQESGESLIPLTPTTFSDEDANVTANLWGLNGTTGGHGIDPYALRLVNKAYGDVYAGGVMDYANDTEDAMHLSNGEEGFRSAFFLVGSDPEGPYEMVLASGKNVTDNLLAYVNRHDEDNIHLTREKAYQHGNDALTMKLSSPVNQYLYKVYDRSGNLAIQAWGDGVAGGTPEIPSVIRSSLVSKFYYDIETLPYTTGVDEIRVTYDVDDSGELVPYLNGEKAYNLKFKNNNFMGTDTGTDVTLTQSATTNLGDPNALPDNSIWKPTANMGDGRIDPYAVTLVHSNGKILYGATVAPGNNDMTLGTENDAAGKYKTFILVDGSDERFQFMAATGDQIDNNQFAYIAIRGSEVKLTRGNAYTQDKTNIQMELVPFQYTYTYIIVNNDMHEAIRNVVVQDGGDLVQLTKGLRSPLLDYKDYEFYKPEAFSTLGTYEKPDGSASATFVFNDATKAANKLTVLPYNDQTIYVRYNYTQKTGGLDLTGLSKYQIVNQDGTTENFINASNSSSNSGIWNNSNSSTNHTLNYFLWHLNGNDPYNVTFTNIGHGNNDVLTATVLWRTNGSGDYYSQDCSLSMRARNYSADDYGGKYKANSFAILAHENGDYRLMAITPFFWDPAYYDLSDAQKAVDKIANNQKQELYYTVDNRWSINRHGRVNNKLEEMETETGLPIQFRPTTTHNYRFHLTTKIDGRKLIVEMPKTMARDIFKLPEELRRKYCTYTARYYVDDVDGSGNPTDAANPVALNADGSVPSGAHEVTLDLSNPSTLYPFFLTIDNMPENTDEQIAAKAAKWVDIYVDYSVIPHFNVLGVDSEGKVILETDSQGKPVVNPDGIPFNLMGWDRATMNRLLNNESGWTDATFQISTYEQLTDPIGSMAHYGLSRKDYLYFMVLNTNNEFTNSNGQYFLRREDNGHISYLNNDFRLHKNNSDNYKHWGYSRLAEYYRENDHDAFQEKHWLWCFAGDPYDLYIYNASSVVEENFNAITSQTEVTTHRDHLVGYQTLTSTSGTTTEQVVNTPGYEETAPTFVRWGLAEGQGADSGNTFSLVTSEFTATGNTDEYTIPTVPSTDNAPLYWCMNKSAIESANEVMLLPRSEDNTTLDFNIQILPYQPHFYQDLRIVIKRDDYIDHIADNSAASRDPLSYLDRYATPVKDITDPVASRAQTNYLDGLPSGAIRMYSASDDREFAIDDVIDLETDMPVELLRKFCNYTAYSDDYRTIGTFTLTESSCAYRGDVQRYQAGDPEVVANPSLEGQIKYNSQGKPMYNYWMYLRDASGNKIPDGNGGYRTRTSPPTTIYVKYNVTTDKFLKTHPTKAEVAAMLANNDHVYFMDFADPNLLKNEELNYQNGHHAYFDEDATFDPQIDDLHEGVLAEKKIWNGSQFVYDTSQKYNFCQYKTTDNRMESVPENLKWYFVGDPYQLQVYCTDDDFNKEPVTVNGTSQAIGTIGSNLCRFDPTETAFQFVVDCVHFRSPDESIIDERERVEYTNPDGTTTMIDNVNYGKPYYPSFYWEVVPTTTNDDEAFALRFRADNNILGYRDVYYYLAHDGIKRTYREAISDNPKAYNINLSYDEDNERYLKGRYMGYHKSNDDNCAIRLTQPAKVYFSAYKETFYGEPVVKEELSEYFGIGETLKEVPRHLQRKFVKYGNLQYQKNNNQAWINTAGFPVKLAKSTTTAAAGEVEAYNLEDCSASHNVFTVYDSQGIHTKERASYKFRVTYSLDDITKDDIHLFTTNAEFANPDVQPQWLDLTVGGKNWMYYDKTNLDSSGNENQKERTTTYPTAMGGSDQPDGWDIGIKGLHWAFIGDPYKFTIINRRRWEDSGSPRTAVAGSDFWLGTGYGQNATPEDGENKWYNYTQLGDTNSNSEYGSSGTGGNDANGNTEWSLQMCKTGGKNDYFIRTSSLKTTTPDEVNHLVGDYSNDNPLNMTNNYARLVRKDFTNLDSSIEPRWSDYVLEVFSLDTKTSKIPKAEIRTAVAEDEDNADNDCFDANVRIYNTWGELKATLKHVEVTFGDVNRSLPPTLRRYGCNYIECYQISYPGYTPTELGSAAAIDAKRNTITTRLQSLENFTGENKIGSLTTFNNSTLSADKVITDENGRKYYEIAYVYEVDEDVAKYFTSVDDAEKEEYTWANADYQWDQIYKGSNVRVVTYENVFDHYEYNADGHIINEVYRLEERVKYKSGDNISTPAYGWVNTHNGSDKSYGDETTQTDEKNQKWAFVGDPYDFEMKNYELYLSNTNTAMSYNSSSGITNSTTEKSHWAITQGLQKTEVVDGKIVKVYTDASGNTVYTAKTSGVKNTPVYVYYLALIDDDETSPTYGSAINYVTFDRAANNKDLPKEDQFLYLKGAPIGNDPTASLYNDDTRSVHPFFITDLKSYANMVIYHLVIAHQHSTDYTNADAELGADAAAQTTAKSTIRRHLAEYLHYKMNSAAFDTEYLAKDASGFNYKDDDTYMVWDFKPGYQTGEKASGLPAEAMAEMNKGTLRDIVNSPLPNYIVSNVGIGNALTVPWYMNRQFCNYKLYQRDVYRSETSTRPVYEEADAEWIAAGKPTYTEGGKTYKVDTTNPYADPVTGRIQKTFVEDGVTKRAYEIDWIPVADGKKYYSEIQAQNGHEIKQLNESHDGRMVLIDVVYDVDPTEFRFVDETNRNETTAWYMLTTNEESDGQMSYSYKDGIDMRRDRAAHYTNDNLWAPEGDPYGFVMHNRYATVNGGTPWNGLVITADPADANRNATTTSTFNSQKVIQATGNPRHAVYEMMTGMNNYSFLMHPTSEAIDNEDADFTSYYMTIDTHTAKLTGNTAGSTLRNNRHTNWRLMTTPEQLLPYFDRAGYVGGLQPSVANSFENSTLYTTLQNYLSNYRTTPSMIEFQKMDQARELVYAGTFSGGKFISTNLVPLEKGYYRIRALSTEALDGDEAAVGGLRGSRYLSGYRFESEKTQKNMTAASGALPLHLLATTAEEAAKKDALTSFEELRAKVAKLEAKENPGDPDGPKEKRIWDENPAMRGNIELPVAEYDPSTIFHFVPNSGCFRLETQGLSVNVAGSDITLNATPTNFTIDNIGGTVITMRTESSAMTTNYVSVDPSHYYNIAVNSNNELQETGDRYKQWDKDGLDYAVQTTKWLLQPVGTQQEWPYNQMPLRVKVNEGAQKPNTTDGTGLAGTENKDKNYYASLYVPFDTRLNKTIDAAFTSISIAMPKSIRLTSVSQINEKGNPQFIPADWPVIIRTSQPVVQDGAKFVELYLPSNEKTVINEGYKKICLYGEYLEKPLTAEEITAKTNEAGKDASVKREITASNQRVMVFGLPFAETGTKTEVGDNLATKWYAYNDASAVGFYSNENWRRNHPETSTHNATAITTQKEFDDIAGTLDKAHINLAHWTTARTAASTQRSNVYVYHNKVYYVHDLGVSPTKDRQGVVAIFDGEEEKAEEQEDDPFDEFNDSEDTTPWPCDVYDLQGRRVARHETPETLRENHPGLPKGVYIFGHKKVLVK